MCTISIDPNSIVALQAGTNASQISLSGTVANCASNSVSVTVSCQGTSPSPAHAVISGNVWTVTLLSNCPCGSTVTIRATCDDPQPCGASYTGPLMCTCCPAPITLDPPCVEYRSGKAFVKFVTRVTVPAGCGPIIAQTDFGDGTLGSPKTYTTGQNNTSQNKNIEIHSYNTYSFGYSVTATVNILSLPSCPSPQRTFTIDPPPPCSVNFWVAVLCRISHLAFLFYAASAAVLGVASISACNSSSVLGPIALGAAAASAVSLLILWIACKKCECNFLIKLLGQLLLVIGVLLSMFIVQPACLQPLTGVIIGTVAALYGGYLILNGLWYGQGCCPVSICDFWRAIIDAMLVAFVAVLFVFLILQPGVLASGVALALALAYAIMAYASLQVTNNTVANNC